MSLQIQLAVDGGTPIRSRPFPPWPVFDQEQISAVTEVLRSGKVNSWTGEQTGLFEKEFAEFAGCRYGVAVANGTLALELALRALGIAPGDQVIVTCRSFVASASCCAVRGAVPLFADVDRASQNVTADTIRAALTSRTKAVIAVHLAGWPCDMDPILELAGRHGLWVIEDCAQAHGATYEGRPVGSLGHVAAFSFCQDKILTTGGEGGMLTTSNSTIWERAWSYKDHGKSHHAVYQQDHSTVFKWLHESIGTNWRMTEMQAAIGRIALGRLPDWIAARRKNAALFDDRLGRLPAIRLTAPPAEIGHAYYKYYAFLRPEVLRPGWTRDRIVRAVQAEGVPCFSGICPAIFQETAFDRPPFRPKRPLPVAEELGQTSLMFLVHPTLAESDVADTCRAVEKVLAVATAGGDQNRYKAA
jgi:dTDP-4-amino-4,6-dideoxygalactose transaminase